ncbi:MAG: MauE/DoxX family redox-associated membrane protein [Phycisphaerales bacterium]
MTAVARLWLVGFGLVLLYGASDRALDFAGFVRTIHLHEVAPVVVVPFVAGFVLLWEWLTGAYGVVCGFNRRISLFGSVAMLSLLASLTVYLGLLVVVQGAQADCGCGPAKETRAGVGLARNASLMVIPLAHVALRGITPGRARAAGGSVPAGCSRRRP